ncbi:hypothetical protein HNQ07_004220 [Deinococcus metalli]|uniref:Uncharacterized protein n=1 Tax=Deinococcus metalli TaxID=1141878 RepID=A0A7W8KK66_9DEIO|nr:hypothetical protein [Deinococcus metalli]MBB5378713.1 hypothetical protein [Deinococcus metalli]GHF60481.1 hypothetical protein GCM10017781_40850 [Deinococcus metalli]
MTFPQFTRFLLVALSLSALAAAGAVDSSLIQTRQTLQKLIIQDGVRLLKDCGGGNGDNHEQAVLFPAGRSDVLYLAEGGLHAAFRLVAGRPVREWCGTVAAEGTPVRLAGRHTFAVYAQQTYGSPLRYRYQQGRLPGYSGSLDRFSLLAGQSSRSTVDGNGESRCFQVVKQAMGLSMPVVTNAARCPEPAR